MKKPSTLLATLSFALITAGSSTAAGVYDVDKAAVKQAMLAAMPAAAKDNKEALAEIDKMVESMVMTVDLKADGSAAMDMKMSMMGREMKDSQKGTWKLDGKKLTITTQKNGKDDPKTADFDGKSFTMEQEAGGGPPMKMTFRRR